MKFSNREIYQMANDISLAFDKENKYIPARANFFIQKNINVLTNAAHEIENARIKIAEHYGVLDEENSQYAIPQEQVEIVSKELEELFSITQELDIKTFPIEILGNTEFTTMQMQAIMFMIED